MDPNATLRLIGEACVNEAPGNWRAVAYEHCEDLHEWLSRGCFAPVWYRNPLGHSIYREWLKDMGEVTA